MQQQEVAWPSGSFSLDVARAVVDDVQGLLGELSQKAVPVPAKGGAG